LWRRRGDSGTFEGSQRRRRGAPRRRADGSDGGGQHHGRGKRIEHGLGGIGMRALRPDGERFDPAVHEVHRPRMLLRAPIVTVYSKRTPRAPLRWARRACPPRSRLRATLLREANPQAATCVEDIRRARPRRLPWLSSARPTGERVRWSTPCLRRRICAGRRGRRHRHFPWLRARCPVGPAGSLPGAARAGADPLEELIRWVLAAHEILLANSARC
jgi:hypothetical protein